MRTKKQIRTEFNRLREVYNIESDKAGKLIGKPEFNDAHKILLQINAARDGLMFALGHDVTFKY